MIALSLWLYALIGSNNLALSSSMGQLLASLFLNLIFCLLLLIATSMVELIDFP